jgi:hypothetical protein
MGPNSFIVYVHQIRILNGHLVAKVKVNIFPNTVNGAIRPLKQVIVFEWAHQLDTQIGNMSFRNPNTVRGRFTTF